MKSSRFFAGLATAFFVGLLIQTAAMGQQAADDGLPILEDDHYRQVIDSMPQRFREVNLRAFELGKRLFVEAPVTS